MTRQAEVRFGERLTWGGEVVRALFTSGPAIAWTLVFLLLPLLAIAFLSFMTRGTYGEWQFPLSLGNYKRLLGFGVLGFDPLYPKIIARSLLMGAGTTIVCILASLPLAFFIARLPTRWKMLALTLLIIPFWTNLLIRTYAWQMLLGPDSFLAGVSAFLGLSEPGRALYPGVPAVYIGMLCAYLPFMALPLYSAVEKLDWSLAEAASDLGADRANVFRHALLPQITPGLVAGAILVFIPATGQFVVPDLLGGAKTAMLGNAIQLQFGPSRDWPFGSAIAFTGMAIVLVGLFLYARSASNRQDGLI
ncbi:MAG TPA: ABC transporter permease [Pseudomonadota bacterium]|nr:ABC transporter permease [Xanthomonadales bacterium]MBP7417743.1 ABC transporter permease [Xanthomonadales bacterium]HQX23350.1 ABC transporter permease [Pseudomonadota bacterium]HQY35677.1 ABC transporter permease [Pseudomonadota bacterium]